MGQTRTSPAVTAGLVRVRAAESGGLGGPAVVDHSEGDQDGHHAGGDEGADGGDAGDHADRRPGVGRQQQAAQGLALEQAVALCADDVGVGLQVVDLGLGLAGVDRRGDVGLGCALRGAEVGVGGAVGDPVEVAVDEAGVGLGLAAGVETLVGELRRGRCGPLRSAPRLTGR